jgi:hypothetical protein
MISARITQDGAHFGLHRTAGTFYLQVLEAEGWQAKAESALAADGHTFGGGETYASRSRFT